MAVSQGAVALCPRFTGTVIEGVDQATVAPLVARRLALAGMRSISPVVDVSNYVMLELGQPNHPYDIDRLGGRGLVVRRATEGEQLVTLDGTTRTLRPDDLVIADAEGTAVGIAGIMGGATAEISETTSTVLLEAANFDPQATSATGSRLGLLSEARTRFERGVDTELAGRAIDRFVELLGPGVRRCPTTDLRATRPPKAPVRLRTDRVNLLLGTALSPEECAGLLAPLGFRATPEGRRLTRSGADVAARLQPRSRPDRRDRPHLRLRKHPPLPPRPSHDGHRSHRLSTGPPASTRGAGGRGRRRGLGTQFVSAADVVRAGLTRRGPWSSRTPSTSPKLCCARRSCQVCCAPLASMRSARAGRPQPVRTGKCLQPPGLPPDPGDLVEGVHEWEQLGLVAIGPDADATYAVQVWEVLAGALRLEDASVGPLAGAGASAGAGAGASASAGAGAAQGGPGGARPPPGRCTLGGKRPWSLLVGRSVWWANWLPRWRLATTSTAGSLS